MLPPRITTGLALALALAAGLWTGVPRAMAGPFGIYDCCCHGFCPKFKHCQEGPPWIKMKIGCSRPVCDPHTLEHFGYYRTCWQAWPFPPDWSHCPVPPGTPPPWAAHAIGPVVPQHKPEEKQLPPPRKVDGQKPIRPLTYEN
jgi:hypothetical protein